MDPSKVNSCKEMDLRSTQDTDGGGSVHAVTGHQVRDVILDLGLLTREASSLKQLGPGRVVVLCACQCQTVHVTKGAALYSTCLGLTVYAKGTIVPLFYSTTFYF